MKFWFVVPAAGSGSRFGGELPKQYAPLAGKTVLEKTLERLLSFESEAVVVALHSGDHYWSSLSISEHPRLRSCHGGDARADSVLLALQSIAGDAGAMDWVLVHDVARPCVRSDDIRALIDTLSVHPVGGLLATPVSATLKRIAMTANQKTPVVLETVPRDDLWAAATPQMFRYGLLIKALERCADQGISPSDEAGAIEYLGLQPAIVAGSSDNLKITHRADLALAEAILGFQQSCQQEAEF